MSEAEGTSGGAGDSSSLESSGTGTGQGAVGTGGDSGGVDNSGTGEREWRGSAEIEGGASGSDVTRLSSTGVGQEIGRSSGDCTGTRVGAGVVGSAEVIGTTVATGAAGAEPCASKWGPGFKGEQSIRCDTLSSEVPTPF